MVSSFILRKSCYSKFVQYLCIFSYSHFMFYLFYISCLNLNSRIYTGFISAWGMKEVKTESCFEFEGLVCLRPCIETRPSSFWKLFCVEVIWFT